MATHKPTNTSGASHGSVFTYTTGFILSIVLTLAAYYFVVNDTFAYRELIAIIIGLAVAQLMVQLFFFLHLGKESKPRWNLIVFSFMLLVVGIIVIGSLWIMDNLDYNMMPSHDMDEKMMHEREKGF